MATYTLGVAPPVLDREETENRRSRRPRSLWRRRRTWARSRRLALGRQEVRLGPRYLNAGAGLAWAGQLSEEDLDWVDTSCSIAADENFGAEPPMGSVGLELKIIC